MTDTLVERLTKERDYLAGMLKAASETVAFSQAKLEAQASRIAELELALDEIISKTDEDFTLRIARKALEEEEKS